MDETGPRDLSIAFAKAFCSGDLERAADLLHPDFHLRGPLHAFDSKEAYLASLRADPPAPGRCEIHEAVGSGQSAAILYTYDRPDGPLLIAQFVSTNGSLISGMTLVFDAEAVKRRVSR